MCWWFVQVHGFHTAVSPPARHHTADCKSVSQSALILIDKEQKLIKSGKSLAMMWGIWLEKEDWFIQLIETEVATQTLTGESAWVDIIFPWYRTPAGLAHHMKIKLDFRDAMFAGDNLMMGVMRQKVCGSGRCRLHMLKPMPIELSDAVGLFEESTLEDNIRLRVETLHTAIIAAAAVINCPKGNGYYNKDELEAELVRIQMSLGRQQSTDARQEDIWLSLEGRNSAGGIGDMTKTEMQQQLQDYLKLNPRSWKDVKWDGTGELLPSKLMKCIQWGRKESGQIGFPMGSANNCWATRIIIEHAKVLLEDAINRGLIGYSAGDTAAEYVRLMLVVDEVSNKYSNSCLRARTIDKDQLDKYIEDPACMPANQGVNLNGWHLSFGVDHGRKGLMDLLVNMIKSCREGLCVHDVEKLIETLCQSVGKAALKEYCSGTALCGITHKGVTWEDCAAVVQLVAQIADRSSIGSRLPAAPMATQDESVELKTKLYFQPDGSVEVEPAPHCINHKAELAMTHYVEATLYHLIRVVSTVSTQGQYPAHAQEAPFFNTRLRKHGLSTFMTSDYQFEALFKPIKTYVRQRSGRYSVAVLKRLTRNALQRILRRQRGWVEHCQPCGSRSEREFTTGMMVCPCFRFHWTRSALRRPTKLGAAGYESDEELEQADIDAAVNAAGGHADIDAESDTESLHSDDETDERADIGRTIDADAGNAEGIGETDHDVNYTSFSFDRFDDYMWQSVSASFRELRHHNGKLGSRTYPTDPDNMLGMHMKRSDDSIKKDLDAGHLLDKAAGCQLAVDAAIAYKLMESLWKLDNGAVGVNTLVRTTPYSCNTLKDGSYFVTVRETTSTTLKIIVKDFQATSRLIQADELADWKVEEGFHIQMPKEVWMAYHNGHTEANSVRCLSKSFINGIKGSAMVVCICSYSPFHGCPFNSESDPEAEYPPLTCSPDLSARTGVPVDGQENRMPGQWNTVGGCLVRDEAIDYLLNKNVQSAASGCDVRPPTGEEIMREIQRHAGPAWTKDFVGDPDSADDRVRVGTAVIGRLRHILSKNSNAKMANLLKELYKQWHGDRNPRYFRLMRVMVLPQHRTRATASKEDTGWRAARVMGAGNIPNTYEILFEKKLLNKDGTESNKEDRHPRQFPFLDGAHPTAAFLRGEETGRGQQMIRLPRQPFTHKSAIEAPE